MNTESAADLSRLLAQFWAWLQANLLSWAGVVQLAALLAALCVSWLLWGLVRGRVRAWASRPVPAGLAALVLNAGRSVWPLLFVVCCGVVGAALDGLKRPHQLTDMAVSLTVAWVIIRLLTSLIESRFWARMVAAIVWSLAVLDAIGLLKPATAFLDSLAVTLGEARISLWGVLKAVVVLVVALEAAVLVVRFVESRATRSSEMSPTLRVLVVKGARFGLYALAGLIALSSMGVNLTSLAVVGGALGVGIGFGLQKIFSNLVSGVILLLDKSIKPGDIIEIGGNVGEIQTLSTRYALLRTLGGKEILVPNEDLISGQVINWTRTDRKLWVSVPVGVAYDADVPLAMRLMVEAARSVDRILKDPAPSAHLTDFGDNSVNLAVGFWIKDPENGLMGLKTDVNLAIWERFLANKIEIPFPQRDIHVKSLPEGWGKKGET